MKDFYFNGNIDTLIDLFHFDKIDQTSDEDSIYEFYEKKIEGGRGTIIIEIEIKHHPEEEDEIRFSLIPNSIRTESKVSLSIKSTLEMTMLLGILEK